ncbi:hypothetical protein D3C85_1610720 [compost metagenome]
MAVALLGKTLEHCQGASKGAHKVGVERPLMLFQRNVPSVTGANNGRIVDENVKLTKLLEGRIDGLLPLFRRTNIQSNGTSLFT